LGLVTVCDCRKLVLGSFCCDLRRRDLVFGDFGLIEDCFWEDLTVLVFSFWSEFTLMNLVGFWGWFWFLRAEFFEIMFE
jgi:hypothetical protein